MSQICFCLSFIVATLAHQSLQPRLRLLSHAYNDKVVLMIPLLTREGLLPPGIHWATWEEFASRFGGTPHREKLFIAHAQADMESGKRFLDYFQRDRRTGKPKGIIGVKLDQPMEEES